MLQDCVQTAIVVSSRDDSFPRYSILASRNSNVSTFETPESSFEDRVETVNLLLSGTVWQYFATEKKMFSPFLSRRYPKCTVAIQRNLILGKHCPCKPP